MNGFQAWPFLVPVAGLLLALAAWWLYRIGREVQAERARESFRLQKERLEELVLKRDGRLIHQQYIGLQRAHCLQRVA